MKTENIKIARRLSDGVHFIECPRKYWSLFLNIWKKDQTCPCPMPKGHIMFNGKNNLYRVFSVPLRDMIFNAMNEKAIQTI